MAAITHFHDPDVARALEALSLDEIDQLPFGVIGLSAPGEVRVYSRTEAQQSGFGTRRALGRQFFSVIAPCMDQPDFRGRIEQATQQGAVDLEIGHTGDFDDPARFIRVRVCSASDGGLWLLTMR